MQKTSTTTPTAHDSEIRIYVACLASYNHGILHGKWIAAAQALDEIYAELRAMLKASPIPNAEEWAIHDYEGFEGIRISEYTGIPQVHQLAVFIEEHGRLSAEVLKHLDEEIERAIQALEEDYCGEYCTLADYVQELTEETTEIPQHLQSYIDYEAMGRDMEINGDVFTVETGFEEVHVFWAR